MNYVIFSNTLKNSISDGTADSGLEVDIIMDREQTEPSFVTQYAITLYSWSTKQIDEVL